VIAIIAILAVVVVLTLNPAELLRQSRDANRVSDMATLTSALNLYLTDQSSVSSFSLGTVSSTGISIYDPNASSTCGSLGLPSLNVSSGQAWQCSASSSYRNVNNSGWIPVNFNAITAGAPIGSLPVDPTNQTSSGLFYAYNTNGNQFEVTANLESQKYKAQFGQSPSTNLFPEVISGGTPTISALYNPSGLVGYYPLNEGSGSSSIDRSGNGNNAAWTGTASGTNGTYYIGGKVGTYAGYFNAVNNYVNPGPPYTQYNFPSSDFSISGWVNMATVKSNSGLFGMGIWQCPGWGLWLATGTVFMNFNPPGCAGGVQLQGPTLNTGAWYFLASTVQRSGNLNLYVNGSFVTSTNISAWSGANITPATNFLIGWSYGPSYFNGSIADVRIYNRVLSPAEVMALYTAEH
jgi:hypothetical protein